MEKEETKMDKKRIVSIVIVVILCVAMVLGLAAAGLSYIGG